MGKFKGIELTNLVKYLSEDDFEEYIESTMDRAIIDQYKSELIVFMRFRELASNSNDFKNRKIYDEISLNIFDEVHSQLNKWLETSSEKIKSELINEFSEVSILSEEEISEKADEFIFKLEDYVENFSQDGGIMFHYDYEYARVWKYINWDEVWIEENNEQLINEVENIEDKKIDKGMDM